MNNAVETIRMVDWLTPLLCGGSLLTSLSVFAVATVTLGRSAIKLLKRPDSPIRGSKSPEPLQLTAGPKT